MKTPKVFHILIRMSGIADFFKDYLKNNYQKTLTRTSLIFSKYGILFMVIGI